MQSDMCVCIYTCSAQYGDAGRAKEMKKSGQPQMPRAILGTRTIVSEVLVQWMVRLRFEIFTFQMQNIMHDFRLTHLFSGVYW